MKTEEFLEWLSSYWPHRCPEPGLSLEAIHRYAGARDLIDAMLGRWKRECEEDSLELSSLTVKGE